MGGSEKTAETSPADKVTIRLVAIGGSAAKVIERRPVLVLGLILVLALGMYAQAINDWFQTDDFLLLRGAKALPFLTYVREAFDFRDFEPLRLFAYRPLTFITNYILYITFGLDAKPYHLISIGFHLINVVLVWRIARTMTQSLLVAHMAALVFAIHPIYTTTVAWISGNGSLLATTGQLLSFVAFLEFSKRGSRVWLGASVAFYAVAMFYHQEVFLLPVALAAYLWFQRPQLSLDSLRSAFGTLAPYGVVFLVFLAIQAFNTNESGFDNKFEPSLALFETHTGAIAMSVLPYSLGEMEWFHVLAAVAGGLAVAFAFYANPQRRPIILIAVVWYHASLMLSELFFTNSGADAVPLLARKLYPAGPAIAFMFALVTETFWVVARPRLPALAPYAAVALVAVLSIPVAMRASERVGELRPAAEQSQAFINDLRTDHPDLAEGDTLFVAHAPFHLVIFCLPDVLCYLQDAIYLYYEDVEVERVSRAEMESLAFQESLGDNEIAYCWRCDP